MPHFFRIHITLPGIALLTLLFCSSVNAEEKSLWGKFVDFFSPSSSVTGEGPEYDELRSIDEKINKLEGQYSRERRPNNKSRIKKELETLREKRGALAKQIEEKEKLAAQKSSSSANEKHSSSSSEKRLAENTLQCKRDTLLIRDTVVIRDTVKIHDTLYVIVANKPEPAAPPAVETADSTATGNK